MTPTEIVCPYCAFTFQAPDEATWYRCDRCDRLVNAEAQRAFERAQGYLEQAEKYEFRPANPKRPAPAPTAQEITALEAYQRTHSAMELAFQSDLPNAARLEGIAIMAEVTQELAKHGLLAPLEANYWVKLLVERNGLLERSEIDARLAAPSRPGVLRRLRMHMRLRSLRGGLRKIAMQITELEQTIGFVDPPHVRPPAAQA